MFMRVKAEVMMITFLLPFLVMVVLDASAGYTGVSSMFQMRRSGFPFRAPFTRNAVTNWTRVADAAISAPGSVGVWVTRWFVYPFRSHHPYMIFW
jgi:hypothetical protein